MWLFPYTTCNHASHNDNLRYGWNTARNHWESVSMSGTKTKAMPMEMRSMRTRRVEVDIQDMQWPDRRVYAAQTFDWVG